MGKTMEPVSFWNRDMKVNKVIEASSVAYFDLTSLKPFIKETYTLYRKSDGSYLASFVNGEFIAFI